MSLNVILEDGRGTSQKAKITPSGQLVVGPVEFSESYYQALDTINTPYNFVEPKTGKRFVITGLIVNGDKNVGTNGSLVEIYEAEAADTLVVSKNILSVQIQKNGVLAVNPLNLITNIGVWINGKMDDDDVYITILGYYIDA
jgi:hypothetical protein